MAYCVTLTPVSTSFGAFSSEAHIGMHEEKTSNEKLEARSDPVRTAQAAPDLAENR
jgi:hypothetical protein